jgi:hypothetical protein
MLNKLKQISMRYYFQKLWSDIIEKLDRLPQQKNNLREQNSLSRAVKYHFHLPGENNFHLLPFKNRLQGSLYIFGSTANLVESYKFGT